MNSGMQEKRKCERKKENGKYRARKKRQRKERHGDDSIGAIDCLFQIQGIHKEKHLNR